MQDQVVTGQLSKDFLLLRAACILMDLPCPFSVSPSDSSFSVDVTIPEGETSFFAEAGGYQSDTVTFTLGFELKPEAYAYAELLDRI